MSFRSLLRHLAGGSDARAGASPVPAPAGRDADDTARAIRALSRQIGELRGLVHQQAAFTMDALRRAGWQSDEEAAQQAALAQALRAARGTGDVIVGPWTGEVGFELLYWIPFLNWLVEQGLDSRRMVVVSRGGAAPWYAHLTSRYADILDLVGPEEFRTRTAGPKKQVEAGEAFDAELIARAREALAVGKDAVVIHPSAMYRLFAALWRKRASLGLVDAFTSYRAMQPPPGSDDRPQGLPADYVVAKFYFSKAFPDNTANRRFVSDLVRGVSAQAPVVLLSASVRLDEHSDAELAAASGSGVFVLDTHAMPAGNLALQTRVICGSRGFVGTYGGFSYLAPFHGVRSLSFFSRRFGFESHHLDLANRVFDRLLPGGFLALDRRATDLVSPAIGAWMQGPARAAQAPGDAPDDGQRESVDVPA